MFWDVCFYDEEEDKMSSKLCKKNFRFEKTLNSKYKPCVLEQLDDERFIVGTYELIEAKTELAKKFSHEDLERINQRAGSIEIFDECSVVGEVYEVSLGGVFALKVINDRILVAHANGVFAVYSFDPIQLCCSFKTLSNMLTTVDCLTFQDRIYYYTAGSTGILSCIPENFILDDKELQQITILDEPIWTVNAQLTNPDGIPFVLIGSEDAKWRLFDHCSKEIIYTNFDAESGVTSFELAEMNNKKIIFAGSYDGHIRVYLVDFIKDTPSSSKPFFRRLYKIYIGGGVWRIYSRVIDNFTIELFGSAMYSGTYILTIENFDYSLLNCKNIYDIHQIIDLPTTATLSSSSSQLEEDKEDVHDHDHDDEKLIYASVKNSKSAVICSYNERLVHFFSIN